MIDRSEASRQLAKAIAYKACGKDADAAEWARKLVLTLECAEILSDARAEPSAYWTGHHAGSLMLGFQARPNALTDDRRAEWERGYRDGHGGF